MAQKSRFYTLIFPVASTVIFFLLYLLTPMHLVENKIYDLFLHVRPSVPQDPKIVFLEIDDPSIAKEGTWPWSRDKMAQGLLVLKEFGAAHAVFDIEYTEKSPLGVNSDVLQKDLPADLKAGFSSIDQNTQELLSAIRNRQVPLSQVGPFVSDLKALSGQTQQEILNRLNTLVRNNDDYLGRAAKVFGHAIFTINTLPASGSGVSNQLREQAVQTWSLKNITVSPNFPQRTKDIRPTIWPILGQGSGAGFPSVYIDPDGVRRRIDLIEGYQGHYFPQLGLAALLQDYGNPEIHAYRNRIILKDAHLPDGTTRTITIPLDQNSRMLINWPHKTFEQSFRHLPFFNLLLPQEQERALLDNLESMQSAGYFSYFGNPDFLNEYQAAEAMKKKALADDNPAPMQDYTATRNKFFGHVADLLAGSTEKSLLSDIDTALATPGITDAQKADFTATRKDAVQIFSDTKAIFVQIQTLRATLKKELAGSFCIIGDTATSTTDIGINPFESRYMNVGTHASVVNTIESGQFLGEWPWWIPLLFAAGLAFVFTWFIRNLKPLLAVITGFATVLLMIGVSLGVFITLGLFIPILGPVLLVFTTFIGVAMLQFMTAEQEKSFYRTAFGHYLSADVINDLVNNPDKLKLGGEKRTLSAIFTDVQGFSSISEILDPADLVKLLNIYLTTMSDLVLDLNGTIDKYEGDAIIAFFGAPLDVPDHARRACLAAVRMKRAERELNLQFRQDALSPHPLLTRIGINTGEMIVGNMGTLKKMDYTIMGNAVNLASRLEGVNKQYGTWVLANESSILSAGDDILTRKLDRVRVVGISNPVRLYELVEEKDQATPVQLEKLDLFHAGLQYFETKDWAKAETHFLEVLRLDAHDGPAQFFAKRCADFKVKQPADNWDGVFNLTTK